MTEDIIRWSMLILSAILAGIVNTIAGGGTLLTFPALQAFGGLIPVQANATSTVALVPGSLAGAWGFRRELQGTGPWLWLLIPPSLLGGLIGSLLVVRLDPRTFAVMVPWLLLTASLLFMMQPLMARRFPPRGDGKLPSVGARVGVVIFQFLVAIYGGYFGAGIGILMLSSLGLMGLGDLNRMNAIKTLLAACMNGVSVIVFVAQGAVDWPLAMTLAPAAIVGGLLGASVGRKLPRLIVRWFVILIGLGLAVYYFVK